jgi:hypothetical protein
MSNVANFAAQHAGRRGNMLEKFLHVPAQAFLQNFFDGGKQARHFGVATMQGYSVHAKTIRKVCGEIAWNHVKIFSISNTVFTDYSPIKRGGIVAQFNTLQCLMTCRRRTIARMPFVVPVAIFLFLAAKRRSTVGTV